MVVWWVYSQVLVLWWFSVGVGNLLVLVTVWYGVMKSRVDGGLRCLYLPSDKLLMRHRFIALGTRFVAA